MSSFSAVSFWCFASSAAAAALFSLISGFFRGQQFVPAVGLYAAWRSQSRRVRSAPETCGTEWISGSTDIWNRKTPACKFTL